jgi:hypothetical protein
LPDCVTAVGVPARIVSRGRSPAESPDPPSSASAGRFPGRSASQA